MLGAIGRQLKLYRQLGTVSDDTYCELTEALGIAVGAAEDDSPVAVEVVEEAPLAPSHDFELSAPDDEMAEPIAPVTDTPPGSPEPSPFELETSEPDVADPADRVQKYVASRLAAAYEKRLDRRGLATQRERRVCKPSTNWRRHRTTSTRTRYCSRLSGGLEKETLAVDSANVFCARRR